MSCSIDKDEPILTYHNHACYRVLMVNLEQEESVDLQEEREKLAPLASLDLLDSLDLP